MRVGGVTLSIIERGGRPALRVHDASAATRTGFAGIETFPWDARWIVRARLERFEATNGHETYGGGRFLTAGLPADGSDTMILDFNRAFSPPCAFTPYATCPVPRPESRLPVRVTAGEKARAHR